MNQNAIGVEQQAKALIVELQQVKSEIALVAWKHKIVYEKSDVRRIVLQEVECTLTPADYDHLTEGLPFDEPFPMVTPVTKNGRR
jgi:hypothetical protein